MISVEEAKNLLEKQVKTCQITKVGLTEALHYVLAEDILAPVDLPLFDQSAMDGYAVCTNNQSDILAFELIGEIKAGDNSQFNLKPGQAVRIFTGAAVPSSADTIVIQEHVTLTDQQISVQGSYRPGDHIRKQGSQITKGSLAVKKGTLLSPGALGFIASLGIARLKVIGRPRVSLVVTGNEIVAPGEALPAGKVYESNSFALLAALQQMQITQVTCSRAIDENLSLEQKIEEALQQSDVLLLTGGISVGKYDLVYDTLLRFGLQVWFYKIYQKPGKPIMVGQIGEKLVFALPGNPASAMVCFYEYVYPSLRQMMGIQAAALRTIKLKAEHAIGKKEGRALFIRAKTKNQNVFELKEQGSDMMKAFVESDCFIYLAADKNNIATGEEVEVHLLPE